MELSHKIGLILARVEILKLKANDHDWQCYVPDHIKEQIEQTLIEINDLLKPAQAKGDRDGSR